MNPASHPQLSRRGFAWVTSTRGGLQIAQLVELTPLCMILDEKTGLYSFWIFGFDSGQPGRWSDPMPIDEAKAQCEAMMAELIDNRT